MLTVRCVTLRPVGCKRYLRVNTISNARCVKSFSVLGAHYDRIGLSKETQRWLTNSLYIRSNSIQSLSSITSKQSQPYYILQSRVDELERTTSHRRLTKHDITNEIWPMLTQCATLNPSDEIERCLIKARIANRLLELCLKDVDDYRVHLWQWLNANKSNDPLHGEDTSTKTSKRAFFKQVYSFAFSSSEDATDETQIDEYKNFSPSEHWKKAPHPSKQMYNLAFTSWRNVIESNRLSNFNRNRIEIIEKAAHQVSSLLSTMENDYSSDVEFVNAYNDSADKSRFVSLKVGAALPDVATYGAVMSAWGQCVGHSFLQFGDSRTSAESFQDRMRLEASAIKEIMELKESMEGVLIQPLTKGSTDNSETNSRDISNDLVRPLLDKPCYNIILATMARQINPSLAEMRLVLQQMMERVMYELEESQIEFDEKDPYSHPSMECFPDVVSYNALIEARASRSAMFASNLKTKQINNNDMFQSIIIPHHKWSQTTTNEGNSSCKHWNGEAKQEQFTSRKSRNFTASEEEAMFAEQVLDEMCNLATVPVRPNVWSYNSVIKAWISTESVRGLQRAVLILHSLITNNISANKLAEDPSSSVLKSLSYWSSKLVDNTISIRAVDGRLEIDCVAVGTTSFSRKKQSTQQQHQIPFAMNTRMALITAAVHGNNKSREAPKKEIIESIGALPHIEPSVDPDLKSFKMIIGALERHSTVPAAKLSEDLVKLLEDHYPHLAQEISIYNSVLNAWTKAGRESNDAELALYAAKRNRDLLNEMLLKRSEPENVYIQPNESSFLMTINSFANAASITPYPLCIYAAKQSESLLTKLLSQPVESRQIAISCFGIVARTWANISGSPKFKSRVRHADQAYAVILKMVEFSNGLHLDSLPFNAVLDAWARELATIQQLQNYHDIIATLSKMYDFLMRMVGDNDKAFNVTPDRSSFNHMIRACYAPFDSNSDLTESNIRQKALEIALNTYSHMDQSTHRPDAHTYLHLIKAVNYLLPGNGKSSSDRFDLFKRVFEDCCEHGHLTKTTFWFAHSAFGKDPEFIDFLSSQTCIDKSKLKTMNADNLFPLLPRGYSRFGCRVKSLNKSVKGQDTRKSERTRQ